MLSANVSQLLPPRHHLYVYGLQDFALSLDTNKNRRQSGLCAAYYEHLLCEIIRCGKLLLLIFVPKVGKLPSALFFSALDEAE
jgi:hypothetical protein